MVEGPGIEPGGRRVKGQALACGWCGEPVPLKARGRLPKWCSPRCRRRAWEQARAAASGRAAVQVVHQPIQVTIADTPTSPPASAAVPRRTGWAPLLVELAAQLDSGRVYDRDLPVLAPPMQLLVETFVRAQRRARR